MGFMGFTGKVPEQWNKLWLMMWVVFSGALLALAFVVPFWPTWSRASLLLFFAPEAISLLRRDDAFPPLTHTIRHFLPNWLAFPLIYFLLGSIGGQWLGFSRALPIGALFGLLGWLTDHFAMTYSEPDPYPGPPKSGAPNPTRPGITL